jgi:hypothetical protein
VLAQLIHKDIPVSLASLLEQLARSSTTNLRSMDSALLLHDILPLVLPTNLQGEGSVEWSNGSSLILTEQWLTQFWTYIAAQQNVNWDDLLNSWKLVATNEGKLVNLGYDGLLHMGQIPVDSLALECLRLIGCVTVHPCLSMPQVDIIASKVQDANELNDVLVAIDKVLSTKYTRAWLGKDVLNQATDGHRRALRAHLSQYFESVANAGMGGSVGLMSTGGNSEGNSNRSRVVAAPHVPSRHNASSSTPTISGVAPLATSPSLTENVRLVLQHLPIWEVPVETAGKAEQTSAAATSMPQLPPRENSAAPERWASVTSSASNLQALVTQATLQMISKTPTYENMVRGVLPSLPTGWQILGSAHELFLAPLGTELALLGPNFLQPMPFAQRQLAQLAGAKPLTEAHFMIAHVLSRCNTFEREVLERTMISVLNRLSMFAPELSEKIRSSACMHSRSGQLHRPIELFLPHVQIAGQILDQGEAYPSDAFAIVNQSSLLAVGVNEFVTLATVKQSATFIDSLADKDADKAYSLSLALLQCINGNQKLFASTNKAEVEEVLISLTSLKWLPILTSTLHDFLPLKSEPVITAANSTSTNLNSTSSTASEVDINNDGGGVKMRRTEAPLNSRPLRDMWQCSAVMFIASENITSPALIFAFKWDAPISALAVARQLVAIGKQYNSLTTKPNPLPLDFMRALESMYSVIANALKSSGSSDEVQEELTKELSASSRPWLWTGDAFVSTANICEQPGNTFPPWLYSLSDVNSVVSKSQLPLAQLGICQSFHAKEYRRALKEMKKSKSRSGPLNAADLKTALLFVERGMNDTELQRGEDVVLVDERGHLCKASELTYNDAEWLSESNSGSSSSSNAQNSGDFASSFSRPQLVHPLIDKRIAQLAGARSLRDEVLVEKDLTSILDCPSKIQIEKRVWDGSQGQEKFIEAAVEHVLNSLLEVCDACKATSVDVCLDFDHYDGRSVLQPSFALLRGPSICVRLRDVVLTPPMLVALHVANFNAGEGVRQTPGLLQSYFLCDTLQVMSGEWLSVFDPSGIHFDPRPNSDTNPDDSTSTDALPSPPKAKGKAFKFAGSGIVARFPDQFKPFEHMGYTAETTMSGTIIRIPLRMKTTERNHVMPYVEPSLVHLALCEWANKTPYLWPFLRNVTHINSYARASKITEPLVTVAVGMSSNQLREKEDFLLNRQWDQYGIFSTPAAVTLCQDIEVDVAIFVRTAEIIEVSKSAVASKPNSSSDSKSAIIATPSQSILEDLLGKPSPTSIKSTQSNSKLTSEPESIPCDSMDFKPLQMTTFVDRWIVSWHKGGSSKARALVYDSALSRWKLSPFGAVAALFDRNGASMLPDQFMGAVCCPVPIPLCFTGSPVRIFAPFILDSPKLLTLAFEDLQKSSPERECETAWNRCDNVTCGGSCH